MPFGEGPRKCLGMLLAKTEMRVSLPHLLPLQSQLSLLAWFLA